MTQAVPCIVCLYWKQICDHLHQQLCSAHSLMPASCSMCIPEGTHTCLYTVLRGAGDSWIALRPLVEICDFGYSEHGNTLSGTQQSGASCFVEAAAAAMASEARQHRSNEVATAAGCG